MQNPPWQILTTNDTGQLIEAKGLVFDIIEELSKSLNFTFKIITPSDLKTSNETREDFDGLTSAIPDLVVEMMRRKTIAITAAAYTITSKGKEVINFTSPISTQFYSMMVARPKELSKALLFMSPFSGYVCYCLIQLNFFREFNALFQAWLCISGVLVCMGPVLFAMDRLSPVYKYKGISIKGGLSSIQNCIWYMYGALLQQGNLEEISDLCTFN